MRLYASRTRFTHFCVVFNCILQLTGKAVDVISSRFVEPIVRDPPVKFRDLRWNCSREIPPEAVGGGIFDCFFKTSITANRK